MRKLSIIIVNYNAKHFLPKCLDSVRTASRTLDLETIVVDNKSHDGSREIVRQSYSDVRLVERENNEGFAKANNIGIRASDSEYVLLLNCDTEVLGEAFDILVQFLDEHQDVAIVAARVVYPDMTDQGVARSFPTPMNALFGRRSLLTRLFPNNRYARKYMTSREHTGDQPFAVDWVSGACLMVRRDVVKHIGLLDEGFFMYWEDADLCYRIKRAGWKIYCVPQARVIHYEGKCSQRAQSTRLIWQFNKSAYRYYRKHYIRKRFSPVNALALAAMALRTVVLVVVDTAKRLYT